LNLSFNRIEDIEGLRVPKLRELRLEYNQIGTMENLSNLRNLQRLDLSGNRIKKIKLDHFGDLKSLALGDNLIESISGLSGVPALEDLDLKKNPLTEIRPTDLAMCKNLYDLNLSHC